MPPSPKARKRGRPPLPPEEKRRPSMGFRPTPQLRERIEAGSQISRQSLSQEIEAQLEQAYASDREFGGRELHALFRMMGAAADLIEARTGKPLFSDWDTWNAARRAWIMLMKEAAPKPPPDFVRLGEQTIELTSFPQPPIPPTFPTGTGLGALGMNPDSTEMKAYEAEMVAYKKASRKYDHLMRKHARQIEKQQREAQEWVARVTVYDDLGRDVAAGLLPDRATVRQTVRDT